MYLTNEKPAPAELKWQWPWQGKPVRVVMRNHEWLAWMLVYVFIGFVWGRDWPHQFDNFGWRTFEVPLFILPFALLAGWWTWRREKLRTSTEKSR